MESIIKLNSRGEENNYLKRLSKPDGKESKTYALKVSTQTVRVSILATGYEFIDPYGGPMIKVGSFLKEAQAVVKSIDYTMGYGYTITFK